MSQVYDESIVIDALNVSNWESPAVYGSLDARRITGINATIAVWENYIQTMDNIKVWDRRFRDRKGTLLQVRTVEDFIKAKRENKTGVVLGWQNASPIENDLDRLALFHSLGVRIVQVTYMSVTCWVTDVMSGETKVLVTLA